MKLPRLLLGALLALAAAVASAEGVESIEGCDVNFFRAKWVKDNKAKLSWSGACKKGLAEGSGVVFLTAPDGTWARFVGTLAGGWAAGQGDYRTTDGGRKVGTFTSNQISDGRYYDADGRLVFEGRFVDGAPREGVLWLADGASLRGTLDASVAVGSITRDSGLEYGALHDAAGDIVRWQIGSSRYDTQAAYDAALVSYRQYLEARRAAEREAEAARLAAEEAARAAEAERTYNAIAGALIGAANIYAQQQQAQLQAYTPPPLPVWTPPAYTPPAPTYQAPSYPAPAYPPPSTPSTPSYAPRAPSAPSVPAAAPGSDGPQHHPELEAKHCVRIESQDYDRTVLANRCGQTIEVTWCVVGRDCNPGYSNMHTLGAGSTWPIGTGALQINFGACFGANKIWSTTEMSRNMQFRCTP